MIKGYQPGSDITLMNTIYQRPSKDQNGKWDNGKITIIFKDNKTGKKHHQVITNPEYTYYITHEGKNMGYNRLFAEGKDLEEVTVPYVDLEKDIARRLGLLDIYFENIKSGNRYANKEFHKHPNVFGSDQNIEDHYRAKFNMLYTNEQTPITKAFFDIEVDTIDMEEDFPEDGKYPINAVSVFMQDTMEIFTFLLRNKKNPQIKEFEDSIGETFFGEIKDFVKSTINEGHYRELNNLEDPMLKFYNPKIMGTNLYKKYKLDKLSFNFLFYNEEDELKMIKDLYRLLNDYNPDFLMAWNMAFDDPYVIARSEKLGGNPAEIICHPDFKDKIVRYFKDERVANEYAERGDFATISSYITHLDQMIHFASRRKGQTQFTSYSLDNIGSAVAQVNKLDYKHITSDMSKLPYINYKIFVLYNIFDVIVQHCIESVTGDIDYVFGKCNLNNTRYQKCHRQTVYLTNRGSKEFASSEFIMGNNTNKGNEPPTTKFPGAFVADPLLLNDTSRLRIGGFPINLFNNLIDFDYASLYPSIIRQFNIAPNTIIAMIQIANIVHNKENKCNDEKWTRAGAFLEDLQSNVWMEFAERWFGLAGYMDLLKDVRYYFSNIQAPYYGFDLMNHDGTFNAMPDKRPPVCPIIFGPICPMEFVMNPDINKFEEWRNNVIQHPNQSFSASRA